MTGTIDTSVHVSDKNKVVKIVANYYGFDKSGVLAYYDKEQPILPMPNSFCFDNKGKMYDIPKCYGELYDFVDKRLIKGKPNRFPLLARINYRGNSKFYIRQNLNSWLKGNKIYLLNDDILTYNKLPLSRYYVFVDWLWFSDGANRQLYELDSLCSVHSDIVCLVKIHGFNPKYIDLEIPDTEVIRNILTE
ncbi:MAG: hypothetical protein J6P44_05185 [Bacteroidales bacterium]|nr:hypothetical protein [Bacteroidales bacterium]